jgi:hypothetical protein
MRLDHQATAAILPLGLALAALACGPADREPSTGLPPYVGDGAGAHGGAATTCTDGDIKKCVEVIGQNGDVLSCFEGARTCENGSWGPCVSPGFAPEREPTAADAAQPMALSDSGSCGTPCDPSCQSWKEDPAGATTPSPTTVTLPGGSMSVLPGGHVDKLHKQPCTGPKDCMCDHYCDVDTGQCRRYLPGDFDACGGADLTMPVPCDGHLWVCNRGDQQAPAGLIVAIINGNSNQLQKSVGQCSGLEGSLDRTCGATTEPIDPGECIDVAPLCGALPNGTKHVVVNSGDYPPTVPECDCGQNHCAMKNSATNECATLTSFDALVHHETYEASCGLGQIVQWGHLAYAASAPSNASGSATVTIEAHTAATVAELAASCADCVTLAEAPASEPETCLMSGPSPCPISLYEQLGPAVATEPVLELVFTLEPTPDRQLGPDLTGWEITYSCVDYE